MPEDTDGYWDIVISSLQDICNANELLSFDDISAKHEGDIDRLGESELDALKDEINDHKLNIGTASRLISTAQQNLDTLTAKLEKAAAAGSGPVSKNDSSTNERTEKQGRPRLTGKNADKRGHGKVGRVYWTSRFSPQEPVSIGSEVAYKLKNRHFEEWIQCEVTKIMGDGTKYEVRDPEPDENNNPGQTFKATYKEILLIASVSDVLRLPAYSHGTKVLARYPETTTFYPAVVVAQRKDGVVRLKFDGEEEVNKETEIERRLVLPFPER